MTVVPSLVPYRDYNLSSAYEKSGYGIHRYFDGASSNACVYSDEVNARLRNEPIPVKCCSPSTVRSPEETEAIKEFLEYQLSHREKSKLFDGELCGLCSDLFEGDEGAFIAKTGYYDFLATNESTVLTASWSLGSIAYQGDNLIIDADGRLRPLSSAICANAMGASTLALASDGKFLIQRQGIHSVSNTGRLVPSSSGAVDWSDYEGLENPALQDIVIAAAQRELVEECALPADVQMKTQVLGYARLPRGAQPDFFCFTELGMGSDAVLAGYEKRVSADEEGFSQVPLAVDADPDDIKGSLEKWLREQTAKHPASVSAQLHLCSKFL